MPIYKFECMQCFFKFDNYLSAGERDNAVTCVKCRYKAIRLRMPINRSNVFEMVDKYRGKQNRINVKDDLNLRSYNDNKRHAGEFIEKHGYNQAKKMKFFNESGKLKTLFEEK